MSNTGYKEMLYSNEKYKRAYLKSIEDPEEFWPQVAKEVTWTKPWTKVLDNSKQPFTKWFVGGELNACYNAIDRHIENGRGSKVALIHDSPLTKVIRHVTYNELYDKVSRFAGTLANLGVKRGDRVLIYMPLIPETIMAMLATVRLGAIHSVVFGGFAARELRVRIEHAAPKVIVAASCGIEPNKIVRYKSILNEAIEASAVKPRKCVIFQRSNIESAQLDPKRDILWDEAVMNSEPHPCVSIEANEPLYILYTSGTTDKPKGIVRPVGGHIATLAWTMHAIYGMKKDDVWWTASDMGWVVGHSYICYGPLLYGITSVMYEGKPDRTPDAGQYFRVIETHKVNCLLTAPTTLRVIKKTDPECILGKKYTTKMLRNIFVAGELCDEQTKFWAETVFQVPILNHWWQTETGHAITATCIGFGHSNKPPKFSTGMPFPGYNVKILDPNGQVMQNYELGRIACKLPLPPGTMCNLYKASKRFEQIYFHKYPGYYDTMDAGYIDDFGYVYVMSRDDDVINVSGHRLSTAALEDIVLSHPAIVDATVIGAPEPTKGDVPLCLYVLDEGTTKTESEVNEDIYNMVRALIGPFATIRHAAAVAALPRTRSGKIARKSISDLARNESIEISCTIEDPSVYKNIKNVLNKLGYALAEEEEEEGGRNAKIV